MHNVFVKIGGNILKKSWKLQSKPTIFHQFKSKNLLQKQSFHKIRFCEKRLLICFSFVPCHRHIFLLVLYLIKNEINIINLF